MKYNKILISIILLSWPIFLIARVNRLHKSLTTCETVSITTPNNKNLTLEIANTPITRQRGLSNRDTLADNTGMAFIFPSSDFHSFWMKNTLIPLDIIWLDNDRIVDQVTLPPETNNSIPNHTPKHKANIVIETNQGDAEKLGLNINQTITIDKLLQCPTT